MNPENEIKQLDLKYKKFEVQRLELELTEMRKSWFLKPSFLSIFVPILAGIITAAIGYLGNKEIEKLQQEKKNLISEVSEITRDLELLRTNHISAISKYLELNEPIFANGNPLHNYQEILENKEKQKKYFQLGMEYWELYINSAITAIELKIKYIGEDKKDHEMMNRLNDLQVAVKKLFKQMADDINSKSKLEVETN